MTSNGGNTAFRVGVTLAAAGLVALVFLGPVDLVFLHLFHANIVGWYECVFAAMGATLVGTVLVNLEYRVDRDPL